MLDSSIELQQRAVKQQNGHSSKGGSFVTELAGIFVDLYKRVLDMVGRQWKTSDRFELISIKTNRVEEVRIQ